MEEKDLWITFEKTGNVVDYLSYKGIYGISEKLGIGEQSIESDSNRDGDDTVRNTYWRV